MRNELEIAAAVASLRGSAQPRHHGLETGPARGSDRTNPSEQVGQAKRFHAPSERPHSNLRPGRSRPGISGIRRTSTPAIAELGNNYWLWGGALSLVGFAMLRAAAHLGSAGGPVIVHLIWPV